MAQDSDSPANRRIGAGVLGGIAVLLSAIGTGYWLTTEKEPPPEPSRPQGTSRQEMPPSKPAPATRPSPPAVPSKPEKPGPPKPPPPDIR